MSSVRLTPARVASIVVVVLLTLVLTVRLAGLGHGGSGFLGALVAALATTAGAWLAPLQKAPGRFGGSLLAPWRPEYEGPKITQLAGAGLVALLVGLSARGLPVGATVLGVLAAIALGFLLKVPHAAASPADADDDAADDDVAAPAAEREVEPVGRTEDEAAATAEPEAATSAIPTVSGSHSAEDAGPERP